MTLHIDISSIDSSEAVDFVSACRDVQGIINDSRRAREEPPYNLISMQFEFKEDPQPVFRGETSTFDRYMNSAKN